MAGQTLEANSVRKKRKLFSKISGWHIFFREVRKGKKNCFEMVISGLYGNQYFYVIKGCLLSLFLSVSTAFCLQRLFNVEKEKFDRWLEKRIFRIKDVMDEWNPVNGLIWLNSFHFHPQHGFVENSKSKNPAQIESGMSTCNDNENKWIYFYL